MPGSEAARPAASERLLYAQRGSRGVGQGIERAEPPRWSRAPITSGMSPRRSPGGLEVIPGGYRSAPEWSRLVDHNPQETSAALAPARSRRPGRPTWPTACQPGRPGYLLSSVSWLEPEIRPCSTEPGLSARADERNSPLGPAERTEPLWHAVEAPA
jgi:hypothetical protein